MNPPELPPQGASRASFESYVLAQEAWADYEWAERPDLSDEQLVGQAYDNLFFYSQACLQVEDKLTQQLIPLRYKEIQRKVLRSILVDFHSGALSRKIVLKARREGVSTAVQGCYFWLSATRPRQKAMSIAHDDETNAYLHGMSETFYDHLPNAFRPKRAVSKVGKVIIFDNPEKRPDERLKAPGLDSSMRTTTLTSQGAGKGVTKLHLSELGLWPPTNGRRTYQTILKAVPAYKETIVVIESTARGVGNLFHQQWELATMGFSDFTPLFFGWHEEPTHRMQPHEGFQRTPFEDEIAHTHNLSDAQLMWRRWAIINECGNDLDNFNQEYPLTPDDAFLASGRGFFHGPTVRRAKEKADRATPPWRGHLTEHPEIEGDDNNGRGWIVPVKAEQGFTLRVWEWPSETEDYLIAGDAAGGHSDGTIHHADGTEQRSDGDYHAAYVFKRSELSIVAAWHGKVDRDEYGDHLYRLGRLYSGITKHRGRKGGALIAVEISGGWGMVPVIVLKRRGYPRIYRHVVKENVAARERGDELGWDTTTRTRPLLLDSLKSAIREWHLECPDPFLYSEASTFVYLENGKPAAMEGCFDDRVLAAGLGCWLWETAPREHARPPTPPRRVLSSVTGY